MREPEAGAEAEATEELLPDLFSWLAQFIFLDSPGLPTQGPSHINDQLPVNQENIPQAYLLANLMGAIFFSSFY